VRTQLAVLATTVADKLDEMDAAVADVRGTVAGQVEAEDGDDDTPEPESPDLDSPDLLSGSDDSPDEPVAPEPDAQDEDDEEDEEDDEAGLEIDIEDADTPDEEDGAGSSEIEGLRLQGEDEEI
jgi:hypothetical protein